MKKWTVFCPLVGELRDPAMRQRHWAQLMDQKLGAISQGQPTGPYPHHQNNRKGGGNRFFPRLSTRNSLGRGGTCELKKGGGGTVPFV